MGPCSLTLLRYIYIYIYTRVDPSLYSDGVQSNRSVVDMIALFSDGSFDQLVLIAQQTCSPVAFCAHVCMHASCFAPSERCRPAARMSARTPGALHPVREV